MIKKNRNVLGLLLTLTFLFGMTTLNTYAAPLNDEVPVDSKSKSGLPGSVVTYTLSIPGEAGQT
ncbi:MAG TPA: hypothetical protein PKG92_06965, partial [Anaerolineaceae bacterium]|nr:hypothetical protein [Anaerolineaceae bacterium]